MQPAQQDASAEPAQKLFSLSDEELEREVARRQARVVDLSTLSEEDLQRELSKRQLAAGVVQNVVD